MNLPALDLLKIDVEGAEIYAIGGAGQTIRRHRPVVVIEQNSASQRFGLGWDAAQRLLEDMGMVAGERIEFSPGEYNLVMTWPNDSH
jgi:hypothetical protein